ncbi:hypothetical protein HPP92_000002 [Vanilla planifolia]|uniref:Uncharacterized protein n=1 Tax=Vanilla planifolia TaxID=51239 RepID=A0A835VK22_VANPL|nr:hypothetical protein HPP92_000002 [Vanilla planifolia]
MCRRSLGVIVAWQANLLQTQILQKLLAISNFHDRCYFFYLSYMLDGYHPWASLSMLFGVGPSLAAAAQVTIPLVEAANAPLTARWALGAIHWPFLCGALNRGVMDNVPAAILAQYVPWPFVSMEDAHPSTEPLCTDQLVVANWWAPITTSVPFV